MISPVLADALARHRERYNARFAFARRLNRRLDPEVFSRILRERVDPVIRAIHETEPAAVEPATAALYDLSLELLSADCLGPSSRYPLVDEVWRRALPALADRLAVAPRRLAAALSNAAYHLSLEPRVRGTLWLDSLLALAAQCPGVDSLLELGQVLAWRCGLAHLRTSALGVWQSLPAELQFAAVGVPRWQGRMTPEELADRLRYPWPNLENPAAEPHLAIMARVGGFRGFGGKFVTRPAVRTADGCLYAHDGECCWTIHADCFGATLQRFGPDPPPERSAPTDAATLSRRGEMVWNGRRGNFPLLREWTSRAVAGPTLAVAVARSYWIHIVAVVGGDGA